MEKKREDRVISISANFDFVCDFVSDFVSRSIFNRYM